MGPNPLKASGTCWLVALSYRDGTSQTRPNTNWPFSFWTWLPNELKNRSNNESQLFGSLIQVKRSMSSNIDNEINNQGDSSSSGSSIFIRVIPGNQLTEASSSDSEPEPSTEERERRCIIEVRVETQLSRELGCIFLFHVPSRGGAKRKGEIQFSGNSSFPFPFPFFSVPFGSAKRNTELEENQRKRKS